MLNIRIGMVDFRRLVGVGVLALALLALLLAATGWQLSSQDNGAREVGVGVPGTSGYRFAGRIDQEGAAFTGYGYLYDVQGLNPNELFADPINTSETTAHFTYYATATLTARAVVTDAVRGIFALDSVGLITFYYHLTPTASFDDPLSFAAGTPIATASLRFQDILNVQSPNRGVAEGHGEFATQTAEPFTFGNETLRFGQVGLVHRVSTFGEGLRTNPVIPRSSVLLAGDAVNTGFRQTFMPTVSNANTP